MKKPRWKIVYKIDGVEKCIYVQSPEEGRKFMNFMPKDPKPELVQE